MTGWIDRGARSWQHELDELLRLNVNRGAE